VFQVIAMWNLSRPHEEMKNIVEKVELRGYNPETFLTGEFTNKIANKEIKPLSVSNIADKYCPTRRDLYFYKGINRLSRRGQQKTWGIEAGNVVEDYIKRVFKSKNIKTNAYESLIKRGNNIYEEFVEEKRSSLKRLKSLEQSSLGAKEGDTDWLLTLLNNNGRAELSIRILHSLLKENGFLDSDHIKITEQLHPNPRQIGISLGIKPDFIVPEFAIVGDIKSGVEFKDHFQLTCTGYALAYENEKGKGNDINWGIIYFFPTRNPSWYVRPLTFAQIYIFPIDDYLRQWFLDIRDEAYSIISQKEPPDFPPEDQRENCKYCKFKNHCINEGLELENSE